MPHLKENTCSPREFLAKFSGMVLPSQVLIHKKAKKCIPEEAMARFTVS